ncbi:MAG: tetratricopeptide repeat protein [Thiopseudomonas sp.]|nr:tetratricopeptide repeat protein [Thiopseudomonas sp.]MCK9465603.1 tetratricopeptide repeat protein [Thiopseudomonas sp.]
MENQIKSKSPQSYPEQVQEKNTLARLASATQCACAPEISQPTTLPARLVQLVSSRMCFITQLIFIAILIYILSGCQTLSSPAPDTQENTEQEQLATAQPDSATTNFSTDAMLSLLTAEIAGHRNRPYLALENYSHQAQTTQNAQIAERAYKIAIFLDIQKPALSNALLWAQLDLDSAEAQRAAAVELIKTERYQEAMDYMEYAIALDPEGTSYFDWIAFSATHADKETQQDLLIHFDALLDKYPNHNPLILAKAILLQKNNPQQALHLVNQISHPQAAVAVLTLKAKLLQQLGQTDASLAVIQQILEQQPDNEAIRLSYARQLISANRLEDARAEFLELLQLDPFDDDYRLALGYINMDLEAWQEAIVYFEELLARDSHTDTALYNLGRCYEELGNTEQAVSAYASVDQGQNYLAAMQRQANLLLSENNLVNFSLLFQQAQQNNSEQAVELYLIEIEMLAKYKLLDLAWQQAEQALLEFPDDHRLLYTRAMVADQRGDLAQLERDLRTIIAQDPKHSIALNALGYTLADRTDRYEEALQLIQEAHELDPKDPATLDSLGWIYFKLKQPEQALKYLEQSFAAYPDAEIAAHLGEVLWERGDKRQARKIWQQGLDLDAEHPVLLDTLKRLDNRKNWFK